MERQTERAHGGAGDQIRIVNQEHGLPFSKGLLAQSLTATGLPPDRAYRVAWEVERRLVEREAMAVTPDELRTTVAEMLGEMEGEGYLHRYEKWHRLATEDRPVVVMIGGATGVGKSTLATQLADRLGIVRVISTDSIRQVMRSFFSRELIPEIHHSSFDAGKAIRMPVGTDLDLHLVGFVEQVEMVMVGVSAIVHRAFKEGTSIIVEGVHLVPGYLPMTGGERAVVLPMVVGVKDPELHRSHFLVRDRETVGWRPVQRYLRNFDEIRRIQDYILERAVQHHTLVVENVNIDDTVGLVVDALYERIAEDNARHATSARG